jgi:hypothetical protein
VQRKTKRPKLTKADRVFWVVLSRLWPDWQSSLILVKPQALEARNQGCVSDQATQH